MSQYFGSLDWKELEELVAILWGKFDYQTELTQSGSDGGIDVIAERNFPHPERVAIQVKHYRSGNNVGAPKIREYSALSRRNNIDTVIVVTSSSFTPEARSEALELGVKLVDGQHLATVASQVDYVIKEETNSQSGPDKLLERLKQHKRRHSNGDITDFLEFNWNYEFHNGTHMLRLDTKDQITKLNNVLDTLPNVTNRRVRVPSKELYGDNFESVHFKSDRMSKYDEWLPMEESQIIKSIFEYVFDDIS